MCLRIDCFFNEIAVRNFSAKPDEIGFGGANIIITTDMLKEKFETATLSDLHGI